MRRWMVLIAVAAVALVVVLVVGLNQASKSTGPPKPKVSKISAAELHAKLDGAPAPLAAVHRQANDLIPGARKALQQRVDELRGHPVVINVWAAWCGPCRVELPVVQQASLNWGKQVAFLGVDLKDNRGDAQKLLRQIPLTYPSYEDPDGKVYNAYKLLGTPATIYYNAAGKQTYVHSGPYESSKDLDADIKRYALS
jgi:cytochrome c biogenesis protein CcmG, thiol:disulfide interchange protein DsbE